MSTAVDSHAPTPDGGAEPPVSSPRFPEIGLPITGSGSTLQTLAIAGSILALGGVAALVRRRPRLDP